MSDDTGRPRTRLPRAERRAQLLGVARGLARDAGTDGLTLARVAEAAGVAKPIAYDHFGDRAGLLAALYREFEASQRAALTDALADAPAEAAAVARLVAGAYIDCCLAEGIELVDVVAALAGSAALDELRREAEHAYLAMCRDAFADAGAAIDDAGLRAIVGAGDALGRAALTGDIPVERARDALAHVALGVAATPPAATGTEHNA